MFVADTSSSCEFEMEIPQVSGGITGGASFEERARRSRLRKRDDVAQATSRPASTIAIRSKPNAMPPCGGAPARSASSRNPKRSSAVSASMPSRMNTRRCSAGSLMRMLPPPSSVPFSTTSYASARTLAGRESSRREIVRMRRREWMMHRPSASGLRLAREQWKISHPQENARVLRHERQPLRHILTHAIQRWIRHVIGPGDQQTQLALRRLQALHAGFAQEFRRRVRRRPVRALEPHEPAAPAHFATLRSRRPACATAPHRPESRSRARGRRRDRGARDSEVGLREDGSVASRISKP